MILLPLLASVILSCVPPTVNTDGSALKVPLTYKFQMGIVAGTYPNSSAPQVSCGYTWPNLGAGQYFFVATAIDSTGAQSALSNQAAKLIAGAPPNPPTVPQPLSLAGPVFSLQITKNSMVVPQVGTAIAGKPCDPTQQFTFGGQAYMRIDVATVTALPGLDLSQSAVFGLCQ